MGHKTTFLMSIGASALFLAACETTPPPDTTTTIGSTETVERAAPAAPRGPEAGSQEDLNANAGNQVFFAFDRFDLSAEAQRTLRRQAAWLRANSDSYIQVQGNCDERGTREYNLGLGDRRANAAKNFLVSQGIDESRIRTISFGKERPVCAQSSESCWQRNRNATTVVLTSGS